MHNDAVLRRTLLSLSRFKATAMELAWPSPQHLPSYFAALERGWSPDNVRGSVAAREELANIRADPRAFLQSMTDREARAGPVTLPDGTTVARLPGYRRWLWDGEFCGSIGFRWQPGSADIITVSQRVNVGA
jgi:predicted acetyltransferase